METFLSLFLIFLGSAAIAITSWQIIYNKKEKGLEKITKIGRYILSVSILLFIVGVSNYFVGNRSKKQDAAQLRIDLTDSFNTALKVMDSSLKYNSQSGRITNNTIGGAIALQGNNATVTGNTISNSPVIVNPPAALEKKDLPALENILPHEHLISEIEKNKKEFKIKDNTVFLYFLNNTNGFIYKEDLEKMLTSNGYKIIGETFISKDYLGGDVTNGISIAPSKGQMCIVVGNLFNP